MNREKILGLLSVCALCVSSLTVYAGEENVANGTYALHVEGDDWGCGTDFVYLTFDKALDAVDAESFAVDETKTATDWSDPEFAEVVVTNPRTVLDAYLVDEEGNKTEDPSMKAVLELYISPSEGSPLNYSNINNYNYWTSPYELTITQKEGSALTSEGEEVTVSIDPAYTAMDTEFDSVAEDVYVTESGVTYPYAHFEPEGGSETMVVWLHGGGEGGIQIYGEATDPRIIMLANEAGNLTQEDFQSTVGGANILIPQCDTYWMDMEGNTPGSMWASNEGTSFFTESLMELIEKYKEETGSKKVILTGCSNGGFMSILMAKTYPGAFDAIVPICPPFKAEQITEEEMEGIKDLPMYFIYSQDDDTVVPDVYEIPLLQKFEEAGFSAISVCTPETVSDLSERFNDADGNAYRYAGHWSWIYFFNNEAKDNETGLTAWDFIANAAK
ncbi:MAG: hypothetical protein IIZ39_13075 [Blautia sp.]|nr:hypothetical protein [Blautia sp.]